MNMQEKKSKHWKVVTIPGGRWWRANNLVDTDSGRTIGEKRRHIVPISLWANIFAMQDARQANNFYLTQTGLNTSFVRRWDTVIRAYRIPPGAGDEGIARVIAELDAQVEAAIEREWPKYIYIDYNLWRPDWDDR